MKTKKVNILRMVELAILTAIVLVLQLTGTAIKLTALGTSVSLVLIPIVLGAVVLGPATGAWLGGVFGAVTYLMGVFGMDAFTAILFQNHPFLTALTCFGKGIAAGFFAGLLYRLIAKKSKPVALFVAAAAAPIFNTGLFIIGALLMSETLAANFVAEGSTVLYFIFIGCAGINFLLELALNLIVAPSLSTVVQAVQKRV
ncbi:MAG: ECF transporter S component [Clostridia bacterium]|nr:ECF transporter S component [Clostridia bacterium]